MPLLATAQISLNISVDVAPPELPVYDQPPIPGDGYIWTPGYWAWSDDIQDYYWVPGTWVLAPQPGYLWTPGYWGWSNGLFVWNAGYWGPHVGFYGGVNYGYGYGGNGFEGGYWRDGHLFYNRNVTNIRSTNITNVYNKTVINNVTINHVSYNGGTGGARAQPTSAEMVAAHEHHIAAISAQHQQEQVARNNPTLRASSNHGHPPIAATAHPGAFSGAGVIAAKHTEAAPNAMHPSNAIRPNSQPHEYSRESNPEMSRQQRPAVESHTIQQERPQPQHNMPQERPQPERIQQERPAEIHPEQNQQPRPAEQPHNVPAPKSQPHPVAHPPEHGEEHERH